MNKQKGAINETAHAYRFVMHKLTTNESSGNASIHTGKKSDVSTKPILNLLAPGFRQAPLYDNIYTRAG